MYLIHNTVNSLTTWCTFYSLPFCSIYFFNFYFLILLATHNVKTLIGQIDNIFFFLFMEASLRNQLRGRKEKKGEAVRMRKAC